MAYDQTYEFLPDFVRDQNRALLTFKEEVEAVDWYNQRGAATRDEELVAILEHLKIEEVEHACMTLEWLRRNMPIWDQPMREILFAEGELAIAPDEDGRAANPRATHEPSELLPDDVLNQRFALLSLAEELDAVDAYNQRAALTRNEALQEGLLHAQQEEIEHACMALEWLRREMPIWDEAMRKILFSNGCIGDQCLKLAAAGIRPPKIIAKERVGSGPSKSLNRIAKEPAKRRI